MKYLFTLTFLFLTAILFARYHVQISLPSDENLSYKVNIEFDKISQNNNYYYLNTTNQNLVATGFKSNIKNIKAKDHNGNPVKVKVKSNNTLSLKKAMSLKSLSYEVEQPKQNGSKHNFLAGGLIYKDSFHLINLNSLIGYLNDKVDEKIFLEIKSKDFFEVHTIANWKRNENTISFNFANYQDLFDTPIMFNNSKAAILKLDETNFKISSNQKKQQQKIVSWLKPVIKAVKDFSGSFVEEEYQFLIYFHDQKITNSTANDFGALHKKNTSLYAIPNIQSESKTKYLVQRAAMHELLHLFIPKRLKSELRNTKHLWLYEGTIEYFSLLLLLRNGMITEQKFWLEWENKIQQTETNPMVSLSDLSENRQASYYQNSIKNFYNKAALVSFFLDIEINALSNNQTSLIDVLLNLEKEMNGKGFKDDLLIDLINKYAGTDFTSFYEKYILNRSNLKYNTHFGKIGVILKLKHYKTINSYGNLTISYNKKGKYFIVKQAIQNTLGAQQGDIVTAINDVASSKVSARMFYDLILYPKYNQELKLTILRNNQVMNLSGTAAITDKKLQFYKLLDMDKLSDSQKLLRYNVFGTGL